MDADEIGHVENGSDGSLEKSAGVRTIVTWTIVVLIAIGGLGGLGWALNSDREAQSAAHPTGLTKETAMQTCSDTAQLRSNHPSTFDLDSWNVEWNKIGDQWMLEAPFTAKNSFGLELNMVASCIFDASGAMTTVSIQERSLT